MLRCHIEEVEAHEWRVSAILDTGTTVYGFPDTFTHCFDSYAEARNFFHEFGPRWRASAEGEAAQPVAADLAAHPPCGCGYCTMRDLYLPMMLGWPAPNSVSRPVSASGKSAPSSRPQIKR